MKVARCFALAAVGAAASTCSFYDASMLLPAPTAVEAGAPDAEPGEAGPVDPCPHARPPARPTAADKEPSVPGIVMAVRTITYTEPDGGAARLGFDLDGVCTCQHEQPATCAPRHRAKVLCDDAEGRDNGMGLLLQRLGTLSAAFRELSLTQELEEGARGMVLEVRGWSGEDDDPSVVVAMYASNGVGTGDGGVRKKPLWDGNDRFTLAPDSLQGGQLVGGAPIPVFYDDKAYVRGGMLVAQPVASTPFSAIVGLPITITSGAILGRLVKRGASYHLVDGQLVGRTSTRSVLTALATVPDPTDNARYLCGLNALYITVRENICQGADIQIEPDSRDPGRPCDALGSAFGITAWPAKLGGVETIPPPLAGCGASYTDDCNP